MSRPALLFALVWIVGCGRSPYPGYKDVGSNVHLHYITLGEGAQLANDSDSVHVRFRAARLGEAPGSYWSNEQWYLVKDLREGAMRPVLRRLHVGDSMSVIAPTAAWPWKALWRANAPEHPDTTLLCTELSLLSIRTPSEIRADAARMKLNDPEGYERRLIHAYIERSGGTWTRWGTSDLHYIITGSAIDTNRVKNGQVVQLSWTGERLEDGQVFDEHGGDGQAFPWIFGTPDQLVQGIETAVSLLREGQEGRFILPSSLAFGGKGIPGTLDPWSPVLYTVHLQAVERGS